jgi:hypothetical protein
MTMRTSETTSNMGDCPPLSSKQQIRLEQMLKNECATLRECDRGSLSSGSVLAYWREKVALWFYDVVDHLGESRSVVYLAMHILDRYSSHLARKSPINEELYEVASMAALFLSIRIAGSGNLQLPQLIPFSRGGITVKDLMDTGTEVIRVLNWDHRIVTPIDFLPAFLDIVPSLNGTSKRRRILDTACYLAEISVWDVSLSMRKPSEVALSAILNAMTFIASASEARAFSESIQNIDGISTNTDTIHDTRARLQGMYRLSADSHQAPRAHLIAEEEDTDLVDAVDHDMNVPRMTRTRAVSADDLDMVPHEEITVGMKRSHPTHFDREETPLKRGRYESA